MVVAWNPKFSNRTCEALDTSKAYSDTRPRTTGELAAPGGGGGGGGAATDSAATIDGDGAVGAEARTSFAVP